MLNQCIKISNKRRIAILSLMMLLIVSAVTLWQIPHAQAATSSSTGGMVVTLNDPLQVRSAASFNSSIVSTLAKGSYVTLMSKSGNFWRVEYADGKYGYCYADYISQVSASKAAAVNISSGHLNVRSGAGTGYPATAKLYAGETVVVLGKSGSWSRILFDGTRVGWVSSNYLRTASAGSSASVFPAVKLNVKDYKQYDSRWASVKLGNSYETMRSAGCVTTSLAMTESFRTGTTITPAAMESRLSYNAHGAVYWPANYEMSWDTAYLQNIYDKLCEGKPVIIGAKKASGGLHWVVVTGYTGSSGWLKYSNFTINDSGSSSRSTLQDFLNVYPNFNRLVYYK